MFTPRKITCLIVTLALVSVKLIFINLFANIAGCLVASRQQNEPMLCLDAANPPPRYDHKNAHVPIIYPCHGEGSNQMFYLTKRNEVRFLHEMDLCLSYRKDQVGLEPCASKVQGL